MKDIVIPKRDIVFKKLFGVKGREKILTSLLESLLDIDVVSVNLDVANEFLPDNLYGKTSRVDVRAELNNDTQINIEIQIDTSQYSGDRCLEYWSKIFSNTLEKGKDYTISQKTICIWILNDNVYEEFKKFHSIWKIREEDYGLASYFDKLEIHVIELKKFREDDTIEPKNKNFWLWFIDYTNMEMVELACKSNEEIEEARKILNEIKADKSLMNEIIARDMAEMDRVTAINKAKREGIAEGKAQGKVEGLIQGKTENTRKIAKNMLNKEIDISIISEVTGLSIEEIEKLK